jgi:hypothetical protein
MSNTRYSGAFKQTQRRERKNTAPAAMLKKLVVPRVQSLATCAREPVPLGNQTALRQIAESSKKNFEPSATKAAAREGSKTPGQKKDAGRGLITKSQDSICTIIYE